MSRSKFFKLYGNCIPVKGYVESIICDLERCCYLPVSNKLFDVIVTNEESGLSIRNLKKNYNNQYNQGIDELFKYINNQGYGFFTQEPQLFPKISLEWDSPFRLTNAIVEVEKNKLQIAVESIKQITEYGCQTLELRFIDELDFKEIIKIVELISSTRTTCVYIFIKYIPNITFEDLVGTYLSHGIVGGIILHSSPVYEDFGSRLPSSIFGKIKKIEKKISKINHENQPQPSMVLNISSFTEAYNFNLGLNRKVCINSMGDIKNYLSHEKKYGNVNDKSVSDIVSSNKFQEKWLITKDKIEVCKDCQFRYMCMDNSDVVETKNGYKRVADCKFNPYENKWHN
ncbi:MAG TPA: grasp-with-spasm system SPASM domain peptide maturase [Tenuifilaceae bacterium]|nr:grasp-with-spasm system SPASM domain peptide maturase [Tenuifilaceae bacterium]